MEKLQKKLSVVLLVLFWLNIILFLGFPAVYFAVGFVISHLLAYIDNKFEVTNDNFFVVIVITATAFVSSMIVQKIFPGVDSEYVVKALFFCLGIIIGYPYFCKPRWQQWEEW